MKPCGRVSYLKLLDPKPLTNITILIFYFLNYIEKNIYFQFSDGSHETANGMAGLSI